LRKHRLDAIVDVTVAYPDALPKTELHFARGHIPNEVHYYIRRYSFKEIPQSDEALTDWIKMVWAEKEERLRYFYTHRKFPDHESRLEKYKSLFRRSGFYYTVIFFTLVNYFIYSMFFYCFYTVLLYFMLTLLWMAYKNWLHGSIDNMMISNLLARSQDELVN